MLLNTIYKICTYISIFMLFCVTDTLQFSIIVSIPLIEKSMFSSAQVFFPLCGSIFDGSQSCLLTQKLAIAATLYRPTETAAAARHSIKMTFRSSQYQKCLVVLPVTCNVQELKTISDSVGYLKLEYRL